ncbi:MAG: DUF3810 domain-containing protein [bacterium]
MKSPTKLRAGIIGLALSFYLLIQLLSQFPNFVESYYSNGLYPIITLILSNLSAQVSFSISELALWFVLLFGIPFIINRIKKKRLPLSRILLNLITTLAVIYVWFYLCWGINYLRPSLRTKLALDEVNLAIDSFDSTFVQIIKKSNQLNLAYSIKKISYIDSVIDESYDEIMDLLNLPQIPGNRKNKSFTANWLLNKTTTSGWFSPFFHELHLNSDLFIFELPFVLAHEKAHQMGITSEADANFLAHLVCTNASEPLCQYSGNFQVLGHFFRYLRTDSARTHSYANLLNDGVKLDLEAVKQRLKSHVGIISKVSNKSYDLYLKANDVKEGMANYSRVVSMIVRFQEKQKLRQKQATKKSF